ncbi:lipoprotein [Lampropedia cohaerens]|uniref:Lipoprotein n=1 Tax=Lampropedia cohaerens TaxID=1610491 RepID=A0A0U1PYP8_9BURK|nr:transglycosylase SLT domain-containing protein [Lampropedia cohaerens]KKW67642.1 lipoprotein [Lampropedia cohaerens]
MLCVAMLAGCTSAPPRNPDNLCAIFQDRPAWHRAAQDAERAWGAPVFVPMAIMYQESSFRAKARPPRRYVLGVIPWGRVSTAYGYTQALDSTWGQYRQETGNRFASRSDFADSVDFIAWYMHKSRQINGIAMNDAYRHYLNYHEGWTGYRRGSYTRKAWLLPVARRVESRARTYAAQYAGCRDDLPRRRWPF